ncbi:MAG: methyltransferase domain-containing protein [Candidatus Bathyarchaeia archaeon]
MADDLHQFSDSENYDIYEQRGVFSSNGPNAFPWLKALLFEVSQIQKTVMLNNSLDIGTGGSATLYNLLCSTKLPWVVSVDIRMNTLFLSRNKLKEKNVDRQCYDHARQDTKCLGIRPNSFDLVCSVLTTHEVSSKGKEYEEKARAIYEMNVVCAEDRFIVLIDTEKDFRGIWAHLPQAIEKGAVSFITKDDLKIVLRIAFPQNSVLVKRVELEFGKTDFFVVVMRKIKQKLSFRYENFSKQIEEVMGMKANEAQCRMLRQFQELLGD